MDKSQLILLFLCISSACALNSIQRQEYAAKLQKGIAALLRSGETTVDLFEVAEVLGLNNILENSSLQPRFDPQLLCTGCSIVADAFIKERGYGTGRDQLALYAAEACTSLGIQSERICFNLVEYNVDIFLYIVDNKKKVSGMEFCASIFQDFECKSPTEEWSITIHGGNTTEKLEGSGEAIKVLQITDLHYDPLYKAGSLANCEHPMCCNSDSGDVTNPDDAAGYWADYNKCDLPEYMIVDTLNQISQRHDDIDYVYFTGDIINHKVWDTNVGNNTRGIKTILNAFADAFGDIPVFPIMGNHEPHPINVWYPLEQNSGQWLLDLIADQWGRWLPSDTKETILKGGYYTVLVKPGFRIIAINSNVAYSFNWWLVYDPIDPFGQLQWMENVLYEAERNRESVHILSHIPSGDDTCSMGWGKQFTRIVKRYSNTITGIFNGHTHYDEFQIYYNSDDLSDPINLSWNGGSLTPFSNHNPNYKIYSVDSQNYDVLNYEQWSFNITEANLTPDKSPNWFQLYNFKEAYGLEQLNPKSVSELVLKMANETDKSLFDKYFRFRYRLGPGSDAPCNDDCKKLTLCRLVKSVTLDDRYCDELLLQWKSE